MVDSDPSIPAGRLKNPNVTLITDIDIRDSGTGFLTKIREMGAERYGFALLLILASMIFIMATHDGKWSNVIFPEPSGLCAVRFNPGGPAEDGDSGHGR